MTFCRINSMSGKKTGW